MEWTQLTKLISAPLIAFFVPLIAQVTGTDQFPWAEFLAPTGALSMMAWYLWFDQTKVRPKREKEHREERSQLISAINDERVRSEKAMFMQESRHAEQRKSDEEQRRQDRQEFLDSLRGLSCQFKS